MRLLPVFVLASGCVAQPPSNISPPVEPPPYVPDSMVVPRGPYQVTTRFELELGALVIAPDTLTGTLHAYANAPGHTMIAVASAANLPALAVLRADLPDALEQGLDGWIDQAIGGLSRLSVLSLEAAVAHSLRTFDLVSELSFEDGLARHRLIALDFAPSGFDHRFELVASADQVLEATAAITTEGNGLAIGDHRLALGIGGLAWDAVSANLPDLGGLRGTLGGLTQCSIVALSVATKCAGNACVGHVGELNQLCEGALDAIVARGRAEASALRFVTLELRGTAGMDDRDQDGIADALFGGTWTTELDAGAGAISTTETFH